MKQGTGEERTLVGTIFEGSWDKGRKHGRGVRKMIFGSVDEQVSGLCITDMSQSSCQVQCRTEWFKDYSICHQFLRL